jgi:hypothetical protein
MSTMIPLEKELPQFEAVALIHEEQPPEPNLIRERGSGKQRG